MGSKRRLKAYLRLLEQRDRLRRFELHGADAELLKADERLRALKAFAVRLAERILAAHDVLAKLAERRAVVITEHDQCPLG